MNIDQLNKAMPTYKARAGHKHLNSETKASRRFDIFLCAFVVIVLMSNNILGPIAPILILLSVLAYSFVKNDRLYFIFYSSWPLLLFPIIALTSVFWSLNPGSSLRYGLYYLMTVILGLMIGSGVRSENMLRGVFLGLLISGFIGMAAGRYVVIGTTGEMAFAGIQGSKNAAGEAAGLFLIVSGAMAALAVRQHAVGWLLAAMAGIVIAAASLVLSKATGALLAASVGSLCFLVWLISRHLPLQARAAILALSTLFLIVLIPSTGYWMDPLFEAVIDSSGKDRGLTGRDLLWAKADSLISERPWLGRGYNAFWVPNNLDAEYLWREMGIRSKIGFNFHNTYREILVDLGYTGLFIFFTVYIASSLALFIRTMITPHIPLIMASSLLVYFSFKMPFETFGFGGMHLLSMLLYTVLAMGLRRGR